VEHKARRTVVELRNALTEQLQAVIATLRLEDNHTRLDKEEDLSQICHRHKSRINFSHKQTKFGSSEMGDILKRQVQSGQRRIGKKQGLDLLSSIRHPIEN
jgi:hypothetical protein